MIFFIFIISYIFQYIIILYIIISLQMQANLNGNQPSFYLQRPNSPKNTLNHQQSTKNFALKHSIGANQNPAQLFSMHKIKNGENAPQNTTHQPQQLTLQKLQLELKVFSKQNMLLRQENSQLRRQLLKIRKDPNFQNSRSMEKYSLSPDFSDLRGTIKKQMGQIKDLRLKVQSLNTQCKMHEQIIEKMEQRIRKLNIENGKKKGEIEELQSQLSKLDHLKQKTNTVLRLYSDLQGKFNTQQLEWMRWKQNWLSQKQCYIDRIRDLQKITQKNYH